MLGRKVHTSLEKMKEEFRERLSKLDGNIRDGWSAGREKLLNFKTVAVKEKWDH